MDIPSVSLTRHDRYTPELRDKIAQALEAPPAAAGYHVLTAPLLLELADTVSENAPILSLYIQLTPERRVGGAWRSYLSSLSEAVLRPVHDQKVRHALEQEVAQVSQAMEDELPVLGRGAAFFSCRTAGLWRQIAVPLPLPDNAHAAARPFIRPLVRAQDEHDRFVIALLSEEISRYFISQIGQVQEVFDIHGTNMRRTLADHGPKERHGSDVTEALSAEAQILAGAAQQVMSRYEARYLVLAEAKDLRASVIHCLGKVMQQRVGDEFAVDIHAGVADIAAAAEPAQRAIEEREEIATVQALLDAGPKGAAHGMQATLAALWQRRVATLVVDDMYAAPGACCRTCAAVLQTPQAACPVCGSNRIDTVEDAVELAIEQTLDADGALELVRSAPARQALIPVGPLAALLRW